MVEHRSLGSRLIIEKETKRSPLKRERKTEIRSKPSETRMRERKRDWKRIRHTDRKNRERYRERERKKVQTDR